MVKLFYTTYISVDLAQAQHEIFRAKVGKGRIKVKAFVNCNTRTIYSMLLKTYVYPTLKFRFLVTILVECLTRGRRVVGLSLTGSTALCP